MRRSISAESVESQMLYRSCTKTHKLQLRACHISKFHRNMVRGLSLASRRQDKEMQKTAKHSPGPSPTAADLPKQAIRPSKKLGALSFCAAMALAAPLCLDGQALAQSGPTEQGPRPRQEPDYRTPTQRAAETYESPGVRVGSFLLYPQLELDEAFNDNIYATSNAVGKTGSFIQGIMPSF